MAHIAVIDDNPDNLKLVQAVLGRAGHRVSVHETGVGFAAALPRDRPDLVLLDLELPDVDGFAVLAELRRLPDRIRVVALTAHVGDDDRAAAVQAGFDGFMAKPLDIATFPAAVARLLAP